MPSSPPPLPQFTAVAFDLGGVIIDLVPLKAFVTRHGIGLERFFSAALSDGTHARFERGEIDAETYADAFLAEFGLDLGRDEFLDDFRTWPGALYPGAAELIAEVAAAGYVTVALSNSNVEHWESEYSRTVVQPLFAHAFGSHELHLAKPDPQIYLDVATAIGVDPAEIVFLDDNRINVDAAAAVGMTARCAVGPNAARAALIALGVLSRAAA